MSNQDTPVSAADQFRAQGLDVAETTVVVDKRDRTPCSQEKVAAMQDLLNVIDEDDVDVFFLRIMETAAERQYNLKSSPLQLLQAIERKHK